MTGNSCRHEELAAAQALHALEPDDELTMARHLQECARCQQVLLEAQESLARLGAAVEQHEPPARLRVNLLDAIEQIPQESPAAPVMAEPHPPAPVDIRSRRPRLGKVLLSAAAVVLVAAVVGLGVRVGQLGQERDVQAAKSAEVQQVLRQASEPGAKLAVFRPSGAAQSSAMLVAEHGSATLVPMDIKPNTDKNTYVMWALGGAKPLALGTFDVSAENAQPRTISLSAAASATSFAISLEPGKRAPASPTDVVATGTVS